MYPHEVRPKHHDRKTFHIQSSNTHYSLRVIRKILMGYDIVDSRYIAVWHNTMLHKKSTLHLLSDCKLWKALLYLALLGEYWVCSLSYQKKLTTSYRECNSNRPYYNHDFKQIVLFCVCLCVRYNIYIQMYSMYIHWIKDFWFWFYNVITRWHWTVMWRMLIPCFIANEGFFDHEE